MDFLRQGNKFLHIEDYALAQRYLRQQLDRQWPHLLNSFLPLAYRSAQGQPHTARKKLRPLRKEVADIPLRAQVSQEVNNRLMDELSTFSDKTPMIDLLAP